MLEGVSNWRIWIFIVIFILMLCVIHLIDTQELNENLMFGSQNGLKLYEIDR